MKLVDSDGQWILHDGFKCCFFHIKNGCRLLRGWLPSPKTLVVAAAEVKGCALWIDLTAARGRYMRQSQKVTLQQSNIAGWFERRNHPTQRVCVVALSSHQLMDTTEKNKKNNELPSAASRKSNSWRCQGCWFKAYMGMDQYLLMPFLMGWTSIYQLFWCEVQGYYWFWHTAIYFLHFPPFFLWLQSPAVKSQVLSRTESRAAQAQTVP